MACSVVLQAGPFAPPAEDVVVFRRDRLPIDAEMMSELSGHLLTLAKAQGGARVGDRRAVAQMLALAAALKPGDDAVAAFLKHFAKDDGQKAEAIPSRTMADARTRTWQIRSWLDASGGGDDARKLAACLGDVLASADPDDPRAAKLTANGEQGVWADWVKPLEAFQANRELAHQDQRSPLSPTPPAATDPSSVAAKSAPAVKLAAATISTVLRAQPNAGAPLRPLPLTLKVTAQAAQPASSDAPQKPRPGITCKWGVPAANEEAASAEESHFQRLCQPACEAVAGLLGPLPDGARLTFRPENKIIYRFENNSTGLSAPLAVLVHAVFSGLEPQGVVLGEIDKNGAFKLPADFWVRLRALSGSGGSGRLVLPAEAIDYLPAVLTLDDPGFFLDYEVLLAANLKELVERCALKPSGQLADVSARFVEIRDKRGTQPVSPYVANRFVRPRLDEIASAAPYHASARMLVIQASGKRSTRLPAPILASELLLITNTATGILASEPEKLNPDALTKLSDSRRDTLRNLERAVETRDRLLVDEATSVIVALRTLARARRKHSPDPDKPETSQPLRDAVASFKSLHARVTERLREAAAAPLR